jgi:chromosomal replication initiation ATPase DnaA
MRVIGYTENAPEREFTLTVKLDIHEWAKFDIRTFDVISFHDKAKSALNPRLIQNLIYGHYELSDSLIERMSNANEMGRVRRLVDIRRYCYYFIRTYTTLSFEEIGALYGQDHSTVMHHYKKVTQWLDVDASVMKDVEDIRKLIVERINPLHEDNQENL